MSVDLGIFTLHEGRLQVLLADPEGLRDFRHSSPLTGLKEERDD